MNIKQIHKYVRHFKGALQFLTIIPVGKTDFFDPLKIIPYFPLVGLTVGLLMAVFDYICHFYWLPEICAVLDIVFLLYITGALHIDGLGDTADGLYGNKSKPDILKIMKDSRIGVMALVAIFSCLAIKTCGVIGIKDNRFLTLAIIPSFSRSSMLFGMKYLPYGRNGSGTGADFFKNPLNVRDFWAMIFPICLSLLIGFRCLLLMVVFTIMVVTILRYYQKRMGSITGDMLGGMCEWVEAVLFLFASAGVF